MPSQDFRPHHPPFDEMAQRDFVTVTEYSIDSWIHSERCRRLSNFETTKMASPWELPPVVAFIEDRYAEGRKNGFLRMDFGEFWLRSLSLKKGWGKGDQPSLSRKKSVGGRYHRSPGHKKKESLSDSRQCWREEKGMELDKSKAGRRPRAEGRCAYYRRLSDRRLRLWVDRKLREGDYEALSPSQRRPFADPWYWD